MQNKMFLSVQQRNIGDLRYYFTGGLPKPHYPSDYFFHIDQLHERRLKAKRHAEHVSQLSKITNNVTLRPERVSEKLRPSAGCSFATQK